MGAGPQDNESAIEQAKDEQISDCKRPPLVAHQPIAADIVPQSFANSSRAPPVVISLLPINRLFIM